MTMSDPVTIAALAALFATGALAIFNAAVAAGARWDRERNNLLDAGANPEYHRSGRGCLC